MSDRKSVTAQVLQRLKDGLAAVGLDMSMADLSQLIVSENTLRPPKCGLNFIFNGASFIWDAEKPTILHVSWVLGVEISTVMLTHRECGDAECPHLVDAHDALDGALDWCHEHYCVTHGTFHPMGHSQKDHTKKCSA